MKRLSLTLPAPQRAALRRAATRRKETSTARSINEAFTFCHVVRFYSTQENKAHPREEINPSPHLSVPPTRSPKASSSASASSLSPLSQRVRQLLAAHPTATTSHASSDQAGGKQNLQRKQRDKDEAWVIDELLRLLLLRPAPAEAGKAANGELHPLLCVRVLQRLGYAMCTQAADAGKGSEGEADHAVVKGWVARHVYPSLTTYSPISAAETSSPPLPRQAQAFNCVTTHVLQPLMGLLGDGTPRCPPHTHVAPVIPTVVEWLCTLPTVEAAVPVQRWLPWVVAQYTAAWKQEFNLKAARDLEDRESGNSSAADEVKQKSGNLPPLEQLLPLLVQKLVPLLSAADSEPSCASTTAGVSTESICEKHLSSLFRLYESSLSCGTHSRTTLAEMLWWVGEEPLVRLPGVRRALVHLASGEADAADYFLPQPISLKGGGGTGEARDTDQISLKDGSGSETNRKNSVSLTQLALPLQQRSNAVTQNVPSLTIRVTDDDAYRRLLLRLTATQHAFEQQKKLQLPQQQQQQHGENVEGLEWFNGDHVLLSLELEKVLIEGASDESGGIDAATDPDVILRFIQPLYDYVALLQDGLPTTSSTPLSAEKTRAPASKESHLAAAPVRLAFPAVTAVLSAVFRRLEELKLQSSCRYAASTTPARRVAEAADGAAPAATAYTLLPQKARLHTLKHLCEVLLHHVRRIEAVAEAEQREATATNHLTGEHEKVKNTSVLDQLWFVDVDARQQEAVLRRFCGAARALVRVVMEERRTSLIDEGPEGSVLTASSITAARRSRPPDASTAATTGSQQDPPSLDNSAPTSTGKAPDGLRESRKAPSVVSFDHTLRTLAFRVVEPALSVLYETCARHGVAPPLHTLTFAEWLALLSVNVRGDATTDGWGDKGRRSAPFFQISGSVDAQESLYGVDLPAGVRAYAAVMEAARLLHDSVGGQAGLQTGLQVLPRPGQQSISALVEGIRLTALQCCLFDGLRLHNSLMHHHHTSTAAAAEQREEKRVYARWVLEHTSAAFFSVCQRTGATQSGADGVSIAAREAQESVEESQRQLRCRLGLLTLVLHVHVLLRTHATQLPSSLLSLLQCLTAAPAVPAIEPSRAAKAVEGDEDTGRVGEWSLVFHNDSILQACRQPPRGVPCGCASQWELAEELEQLAVEVTAEDGEGEATVAREPEETVWRWLGSPEALWAAVERTSGAGEKADCRTAAPADSPSPPPRLFLLPWTTVAQSHQLLRVYDESGQSRRAAQEWEATLQVWLTSGHAAHSTPTESSESAAARFQEEDRVDKHRAFSPVVRLVSIAEEVRFFSALQEQPSVQLSVGVRVDCEEVREEVEFVAPFVRRRLQAADAEQSTQAASSLLKEETGWYAEDDYDGLD